jgi:hypothetical protein
MNALLEYIYLSYLVNINDDISYLIGFIIGNIWWNNKLDYNPYLGYVDDFIYINDII